VIHVSGFAIRRAATLASKLAGSGNKVDERPACAQMVEAKVAPRPLKAATQGIAVEIQHPLDVRAADHDVIQTDDFHIENSIKNSWNFSQAMKRRFTIAQLINSLPFLSASSGKKA